MKRIMNKRIMNFRLTKIALKALRDNVRAGQRSEFIRQAIDSFLQQPVQDLYERHHLRGFEKNLEQVAAMINEDCMDRIKNIYPDVSASVVIETAIMQAINNSKNGGKKLKNNADKDPETT
jgi:hypothetical protein